MTVDVASVDAHAKAERGRPRVAIANVSFHHGRGVLAILGAPKDGTSLLLDILAGVASPRSGSVTVLGEMPEAIRSRIARVSLDAPLPDALRVEEVCELAADLRGEARRPATDRLGVLGAGALARRRVASLSLGERRAVALALALTSKADVLLLEEPLASIEAVAPRLVVDAVRAIAAARCVVVTTSSARDASRLADGVGLLASGSYTPLSADITGPDGTITMRVVVSPAHAARASVLAAALAADAAVKHVTASAPSDRSSSIVMVVAGPDLVSLSRAITRAVASASVDVELIEPDAVPLDAIRVAFAEHASVAARAPADAGVARPDAEAPSSPLPPPGAST